MDEEKKKKYGLLDQADKIAVSGGISIALTLSSVQKGWLSFLLEFICTWLFLFVVMYIAQIAFDSMKSKKAKMLGVVVVLVAALLLFHPLIG